MTFNLNGIGKLKRNMLWLVHKRNIKQKFGPFEYHSQVEKYRSKYLNSSKEFEVKEIETEW